MAKAKEQPTSEDAQPAEDLASDHVHAEFESIAALKERYEELMGHLMAHESRLANLEKHAHSDHALGADVINQIAAHAANHAIQHVHQVFGHSGMPVRGDQA